MYAPSPILMNALRRAGPNSGPIRSQKFGQTMQPPVYQNPGMQQMMPQNNLATALSRTMPYQAM